VPPVVDLASPEDIDELARLRHALYDEYGDADLPFTEYLPAFREFASRALADQRWRAWVARQEGCIVATMWMEVVERIPQPIGAGGGRPIGYLTNAYVEPGHRNEGLGTRMLTEIREWAQAEGVGTILCWPAPGEHAERFYERAGFGRDGGPLTLDLSGKPAPR
jgi:GNAT superfamily N-acetyltransferase